MLYLFVMSRTLHSTLYYLGCNDKQISFYSSCFELGRSSITAITKHARLQRSTAYIVAQELIDMGLILEDHKNYKKLLVAVEPEVLLRKLESKHRQIGRQTLSLREELPELHALQQSSVIRPRVRTFEGMNGLLSVLKDILSEKQEILLWTNQHAEQKFFSDETHRIFIQERIIKQIPARVLAVNNMPGKALLGTDRFSMRQTRLLPNGTTFTAETYIYGNKVAVLDFSKDIFGIITENKQIADSQRAIFELTWENLDEI